MKKAVLFTALVFGFCGLFSVLIAQVAPVTTQSLNKMPLAFTKNMGQWDEQVQYRTSSGGATIWICKDKVVYQFLRTVKDSSRMVGPSGLPDDPMDRFAEERDSVEQLVITARFVDPNPKVEIVGEGLMEYKCNYFIGNDPGQWRTDVPNYEAIMLQGIYAGVDLRFYGGEGGKLTYQYVLAQGADRNQVIVEYEGFQDTTLDTGRMTVQSKWGEIAGLLSAPTNSTEFIGLQPNWLQFDAEISSVPVRSPQTVQLVFSTFLGGAGIDEGRGIAVDVSGSAYVAGYTYSADFPTQSDLDPSLDGASDAFVTKLSNSGSDLIYSTFLGGSGTEQCYDIAVDGDGCAFITGYTNSADFPTQNAFDASLNGPNDVFVSMLSSSGSILSYSTFLGGSGGELQGWIAIDGDGNAYITGSTSSADFPMQGAFDAGFNGGQDAFVTKLSSSGISLIYSTFLGGSGIDGCSCIEVDGAGCAYITGFTASANFPTQNAFDSSFGGSGQVDAFVTKLTSSGTDLSYSTFLGASKQDIGVSIAVDGAGNAYVTGYTYSTDFPTKNAFDANFNDSLHPDAFVTKLSSPGSSLVYSTLLGGSHYDAGYGIAVDDMNCAYVTGITRSVNFPTQDAFDASHNGGGYDFSDAFVTKLSSTGSSLVYSTYLGGSDDEYSFGIAIDNVANAYVTGPTDAANFPTQNAYDAGFNGGSDVFVTKLEAGTAMSNAHGLVFDKFGTGLLAGATVELYQSNLLTYSTTSDGDGHYDFGTIPSGTYEIRVNQPGYFPYSRTDVIEPGEQFLQSILLFDTIHYMSTSPLHTAFLNFQTAFGNYFASDCMRVQATLDLQFGKLIEPEFSLGRSLATELSNRLPYPSASVLHQIANDKNVYTKRNALSIGSLLYWTGVNTALDYQKADLTSFLNSSTPPGASIYSKKAIVMTERAPMVYSMNDLNALLAAPVSFPPYVLKTYPSNEISSHLSAITLQLQKYTNASLNNPSRRIVLYERLPGNCDVDAVLPLPLGDLGENYMSFRDQYLTVQAQEKRERSVATACSIGEGTRTLAGMSTDIGEDLSFFSWVVIQGCQAGVFLSDVINAAAAGDLAVNLMNYSGYWPEKLAQLFRVYDAFTEGITHSLEFPSDLDCSQALSFVGPPSTPNACVQSDEDYAVATGHYTFRNDDPARDGKVRIEGKVNRVRSVLGRESHWEAGFFKSATYTIPSGQTVSVPVEYPIPDASLWDVATYFEIVPNFITSDENGPGPITTVHDDCVTPQWFENTTSAIDGVVHQGQEILQVMPNQAGNLWNKVTLRFRGSEVDLHLYDGLGGHLGRSYTTGEIENTIPDAFIFGDSTNEEIIHYAVDPTRSYEIKVVGVYLPDSEQVFVDVTRFSMVSAQAVVTPDVWAGFGQQGDTLFASVSVRDLSGQNEISIIGASVTDLISGESNTIPSSAIQLNYDSGVQSDSSVKIGLWIESESIPVGVYAGTGSIHTDAGGFDVPVSVTVYAAPVCGDADSSGVATISDVVYLVNYIFGGGPAPVPVRRGDPDCTGTVTISDAVYLINYIFGGGAAPCAACP